MYTDLDMYMYMHEYTCTDAWCRCISATVPARCGRVRMPVSCLVRFCNVSKGRPIPLPADRGDPGATPGQPLQKTAPLPGAPNRYKTSQDDQERAYKVSKTVQQGQDDVREAPKTVKDGSRSLQDCQETPKTPPHEPWKAKIIEQLMIFL